MGVNRRGHNSSGSGKSNKHRGIGGNKNKHRGPRHGHGNRGKGGGGPGSNNIGMTIAAASKLYANQLAEGTTLQQAMASNPSETIRYWDLIDDKKQQLKAEEKALDTQYKNDQAIYNNNKKDMSVTISPSTGGGSGPQQQTDEEWLQDQYMKNFGRSADTKTKGGASYWLDQMAKNPTSHSRDEVARMLGASAEAKSFASDGVVRPGGVRRDQSVYSQGVAGQEYAKHFQPGGALAGLNSADTLNQIAANTYKPMPEAKDGEGVAQVMPGVDGGYFQFADNDITGGGDTGGGDTGGDGTGSTNWWESFADIDAFKDALGLGDSSSSGNSMNDFMQFMMFMNMMRPQGGGYGGSQYGYGGLNPGGVMSAYNPMDNFQGYMDAFNTLKGGTTTNTGTT